MHLFLIQALQEELSDHTRKLEAIEAELMDDQDYLPPEDLKALKEELDTLQVFQEALDAKKISPGIDEHLIWHLICGVCLSLPPDAAFVCGACEFILCAGCQVGIHEHPMLKSTCPGCRSKFVDDSSPKRSKIIENVIRKIRESQP